MKQTYIVDGVRTPIGKFKGTLAAVRTDDLAAMTIAKLMEKNPDVDPSAIDDVILGCANQAGEDNRNVARMAALLAGLPWSVPGETVNRLCALRNERSHPCPPRHYGRRRRSIHCRRCGKHEPWPLCHEQASNGLWYGQ